MISKQSNKNISNHKIKENGQTNYGHKSLLPQNWKTSIVTNSLQRMTYPSVPGKSILCTRGFLDESEDLDSLLWSVTEPSDDSVLLSTSISPLKTTNEVTAETDFLAPLTSLWLLFYSILSPMLSELSSLLIIQVFSVLFCPFLLVCPQWR